MRECFGKYPNTIGFPCKLCEHFSECHDMNNYYIISNKHTNGMVRTLWQADGKGYTLDLNEAGVYSTEQINELEYPIINESNINDRDKYDTFAISIKNIELLGKKMLCILN